MEVRLLLTVSESFIQPKAHVIYELSRQLEVHFASISFDEKVQHVEIGLLMGLQRPGYEKWYQPRRPTYVDNKDIKSKLTGEVHCIRKQLNIELTLDEVAIGNFLKGSDVRSQLFLLDFLTSQLEQLKLPLSVRSFDRMTFVKELHIVKRSIQEAAT